MQARRELFVVATLGALAQACKADRRDAGQRSEPTGDLVLADKLAANSIPGGELVRDAGRFPFAATLVRRRGKRWEAFCGGTLIADRWVLTAAHCSPRPGQHVVIGRLSLSSSEGAIWAIRRVVSHPDYSAVTYRNDISAVELDRPVDEIEPVHVASVDAPRPGDPAWTIGWEPGTQRLREIQLSVVAGAACDQRSDRLADSTICAGRPGASACAGDSGGPLMVRRGQRWEQLGIVSFGLGCGRPDQPGIYTRVASYHRWLREETGL